jgi:acetylornithine deacetylase
MEALARRLLADLVAFDTTSAKSNLDCQRWIANRLADVADDVRWIHHPAQPKANLLLRIGPAVAGGVVLSGHVDVVPIDGQSWTVNPYLLTEQAGRLYGRGTTDMKGFVALSMALALSIRKETLRRPLWLALSYDEEIGCLGVPSLIEALLQVEERPSAVIVGEPSEMHPINKHKGCSIMRLEVTGKAAHSSSPHLGASAIIPTAKLITFLEDYFSRREKSGPFAEGFEPPHSTFNAGRIFGGSAVNIIPAECRLDFEFRDVPGDEADAILRDICSFVARELPGGQGTSSVDQAVTLERVIWCPSLEPEPNGEAETLAAQLSGFNATGAVPFGTEAGFFQKAGYSTIVCGPGNIAQAHQPDEFIEVDQLRMGAAFMERLGLRLAS